MTDRVPAIQQPRLRIVPVWVGPEHVPALPPDSGSVYAGSICEGIDGARVPVCASAPFARCDVRPLAPGQATDVAARRIVVKHFAARHARSA